MSKIFHKLFFHFVWSTKNRLPLIDQDVENMLYKFIKGKCKREGYRLIELNGIEDHIHILVEFKPIHSVPEFANIIKGSSSHFINKQSGNSKNLYWQQGYGVLSVSENDVPAVQRYIQRQKEHHKKNDLRDGLELTFNVESS